MNSRRIIDDSRSIIDDSRSMIDDSRSIIDDSRSIIDDSMIDNSRVMLQLTAWPYFMVKATKQRCRI